MASQPLQLTSVNQLLTPQGMLTIDRDLPELVNILNPVAHKCAELGIQLGVKASDISNLQYNNRDCKVLLREIIAHRLKQLPALTWNDIVHALCSNSVQEKRLANEIESHYIQQSSASTSPLVSTPSMPTQTSFQPTLDNQSAAQPLQQASTLSRLSRHSVPHLIPHSSHPGSSLQRPATHYTTTLDNQSAAQPLQQASTLSRLSRYSVPHLIPHSSPPRPSLQQPATHQHQHHLLSQSSSHPRGGVPPSLSSFNQSALGALCHHPPYYHSTPTCSQFYQPHIPHWPFPPHWPPPFHQPHLPCQLLPPHQPLPPNQTHSPFQPYLPYQPPAYYPLPTSNIPSPHPQLHTHHHTHYPLHHEHGSYSDPGPPQPNKVCHEPMAQYISYVRTIYRSSEVERNPQVTKWPPTPSKMFINLVCIDRRTVVTIQEADEITRSMVHYGSVDVILGKKRPIEFSNITRDLPDTALEKVVLVEGAPGVGKSTFACEFCRRWERGEIAQQYQLVLLLRLRDERMSKAQSVADLIFHPSDHIRQAVVQELESTLGVNTLIILEGFDELPSACRSQSSVFMLLIQGQLLPDATVIVTSRPWATRVIHRGCSHRIFQHIEILGFTSKQIEEYVTSVFTDEKKTVNDKAMEKIKEVMSYIKTYPQIKACMYIPLNSAIVVSVYQESKAGKCILPKTLTGLYYTLLQTLLLRYLNGHPEYGQREWEIQSLEEDLPQEVYSKLLAISKLAYSGICADQEGSVQLIYNLPPDFETLGLMQSVSQLYVTRGVVMSYNFLHLTVQEFLAALHISNMSPEKQLEHFLRHWKEGRWRVVLRFLAGITKLASLSPEDLRGLLLEKPKIRWDVYSVTEKGSELMNWMFETQRDDIVPLVLQERTVEFMCKQRLMLLDYYSLGYCIVHSHCQWVLTQENNAIGKEAVGMIVAGAKTRDDTSARVVGLSGFWRQHDSVGYWSLSISAEGLHTLFTGLENMIHLQELHLQLPAECCSITWPDLSGLRVLHLAISHERNWRLDTLLPHLSLESLIIEPTNHVDTIVFGDCVAIGRLLSSSICLKCVHFGNTRPYVSILAIDPKGMEAITKAMSKNEHIALRSVVMECKCTFSDTAAHSLAVFIRKSTTLHYLRIFRCTFSAHGLLELAQAIHHSSSLQKRELKYLRCTIDGDDQCVQLLHHYPHMVDWLDWKGSDRI